MTSCGSPSISLRPASTATIRSTTRSSACTMCSIHTIDTPAARISLIVSTSSRTSPSVSPPAISSSSSKRGLRRQRPGELEALAVEQGQRARNDVGLVDHAGPFAAPRPQLPLSTPANRPTAPNVLPTSTFSNTVRPSNGRGICAVRPMPRWHRAWADSLVMSAPARTMVPLSDRRSPAIRLSSVVLPAPFGPTMPRASPSATSNVKCSTTCKRAETLADVVDFAAVPSYRHGDDVSRAASACHWWGSRATVSCW